MEMKRYQCCRSWEETYFLSYKLEIEAESEEEAELKFEEAFCEVMNNDEEHFDKFSAELVGDTILEEVIEEEIDGNG